MNPLVINLILFAFWTFLFRKQLNPQKNGSLIYAAIISIQLIVVVAISPILSDALNYERSAQLGYYGNWELGWVAFSRIVWSIWPSGKALMLATSLCLIISFGWHAWKYSNNLALSYLIFICMGVWGMSFYILRQSMAIALVLLSIDWVIRRKPIPFIVIVLLAAQFHQSAYLFLLVYPISLFRRNGVYHLFAILIGLILLVSGSQVASIMLSYARIDYGLSELSGQWYLLLLVLIQIIIGLCGRESRRNNVDNHMVEIGTVLQTLALYVSVLNRAVQFFAIGVTTSLPNALSDIEEKRQRYVWTVASITGMLLYYIFVIDFGFPGGLDAFIPVIL